jgi:hypothetical protein
MFIDVKWVKAKKKVTINELVTVNEYGIKPIKLDMNIKRNKKNKFEKYWYLFNIVLLFIIFLTK